MPEVGEGFNLDGVAIMKGATAADTAPIGMVAFDGDGVLKLTKLGDESAVLRNDDIARVVSDAVVPIQELASQVRYSFDGSGVAIVIDATSSHRAPSGSVGFHSQGENGLRWSGEHTNTTDGFASFWLV